MKKVVYTSTNGVNIHYLKIEGDRVVRYLVVGHDSFAGTTSFNSKDKEFDMGFYESNKNYKPDSLPIRTKTLLIKGLFR